MPASTRTVVSPTAWSERPPARDEHATPNRRAMTHGLSRLATGRAPARRPA
ncbi:hypothetical protein [Lysobacter gummosus]|uniref:hypothetical protein n=1 Tax=Lysobacter gummosus TaxID=262324 RepID=UPI00362763A3